MIYMDNAATTRMSQTAIDAMLPYMDRIYGNPSSLHTAGREAADALRTARKDIARVLGCTPGEIIFTSGGSEADNQALQTAARIGLRKNRKHIISTPVEHHAVLPKLEALKKQGFEITLLPVDEYGLISANDVKQAIRPDTVLVSVMFANNEIGTVYPVEEISRLCRDKGIFFHTDAVQAAGHIPFHLGKMSEDSDLPEGCADLSCADMMSLSAHKFHGPKGIGLLYMRKGIPAAHLIEGGAQEAGRRAGTENVPAIMGMAAALKEACGNISENTAYTAMLRDRLISGILREIPQAHLNGHPHLRLPGNVHFSFPGITGEKLLLTLDAAGICASAGSACTSASSDQSHVLRAAGQDPSLSKGALRLSLCELNTPEEADEVIRVLKQIMG